MASPLAGALLKREVCPDFDYEAVRSLRRTIMEEWVEQNGISPRRGAPEILRYAKAHGILLGLATTTPQGRVGRTLERLGMTGLFDAAVCGDMIRRGKPAPDIYLEVLRQLGTPREQTIPNATHRSC